MAKIKGKDTDEEGGSWEEIGIGDQVKHPNWGVGTVLFRSGTGESSKAIVVFPEEGQKKLMLKFAKLKRVGTAPKSEVAKIKAASEKFAPPPIEEPPDAEILPDVEPLEPLGDEEADIFVDEGADGFEPGPGGPFKEFKHE